MIEVGWKLRRIQTRRICQSQCAGDCTGLSAGEAGQAVIRIARKSPNPRRLREARVAMAWESRESSHRIPKPWNEYADIHMRESAGEVEGCQKRGIKCMLPRLPRSFECEISPRMEGGCGGLMIRGCVETLSRRRGRRNQRA